MLVLVDIGDIRQAIDEITELTAQPMLILNEECRVTKANDKFCQVFGMTRTETEGRGIFELGGGQWDIPTLQDLPERILPESKRIENYRFEHEFPKLGHRKIQLSARRLYQQSKGTPLHRPSARCDGEINFQQGIRRVRRRKSRPFGNPSHHLVGYHESVDGKTVN